MKVVVLYDSQFGNTEKVAKEIATHIPGSVPLSLADASHGECTAADVLIVGSPTQGGRATVRLHEFLDALTLSSLKNCKVAAFDTRFREEDLNLALKLLVKTIGYAAPKLAHTLKSKGGKEVAVAEGFYVSEKEGPLRHGELERAAAWAKKIVDHVALLSK